MGNFIKSLIEVLYDKFLLFTVAISNGNLLDDAKEIALSQNIEQSEPVNKIPKRPRLVIVLGINEEIIQDFVIEIIEDMLSEEYDLQFISVDYGEFVYEISQHRNVDLYVFLLNNLWYTSDAFSGETNAEKSISLIRALKSESETPIIAFSGVANAVSRALPAGANHSLGIPFSVAEITDCVKSSLKLNSDLA